MTDCIIKAFGGCACPPGECAEKPATVAPVVQADVKTILLTAIVLGMLFTWVAYVALPKADEHYRKVALDQQEQYHVNRN